MKSFTKRWVRLVLLAAAAGGLGYVRFPALAGSSTPKIEAFSVSSPVVTNGEAVTLEWRLLRSNPAQLLSAGTAATYLGVSASLKPTLSTDYTLVAQNRFGSEQQTRQVTVRGAVRGAAKGVKIADRTSGGVAATGSGGAASGGTGGGAAAPEGTLGVSLNPDGPFFNDEASPITSRGDKRVLKVAPGGEFYIAVRFSDPDGVTRVSLLLVNRRPDGLAGTLSPDRPPFSVVGAPTGDCRLGLLPTAVRCVFPVRVAEDARNISALPGAGGEFAYVFRARATDGLGNSANREVRGYVSVTTK